MPDSDSLYHRLFSHPRMVEELVREFVPEALAEDLDFQALQRVNPKFHIGQRSARRREGDVIWRLPTRKGADVYLYVLIEFQSDIDWRMVVRTQVYQGLPTPNDELARRSTLVALLFRFEQRCPPRRCGTYWTR